MASMGTKLKMSTSFHPQTDGQTERVNRMIQEYLRHYVSAEQDDWDELLPLAEFALNDSYQESIGTTPFYLTDIRTTPQHACYTNLNKGSWCQ